MRLATRSRTDLGKRHVRPDPPFYVGRKLLRWTMSSEGSRHVRLEYITESINDEAHLLSTASGIPMLRLNNVRPCKLDLSDLSHVDGTAVKWINVQENDALVTRAAQPSRAAAVQSGVHAELAVSSELTVIRPRPAVLPDYLASGFCAPTLNRILHDLATRGGSSALPHRRFSDIERLPMPLSPRSLRGSLGLRYQQAVDLIANARAEFNAVVTAIHAEIDHRVSGAEAPSGAIEVLRSQLADRWDVPFNPGRECFRSLGASSAMRSLFQLTRPASTSQKSLVDDEEVFAVNADDMNESTFLVQVGEVRLHSDMSSRLRQRLEVGDGPLCTTRSGDQVAYLAEEFVGDEQPLLGSATFTAPRSHETLRVFAVPLAHPLVRKQLRLLSSCSIQRFVNRRDLDELLIPVLGQVLREDFETRLTRAMQRRREALRARPALIEAADDYLGEGDAVNAASTSLSSPWGWSRLVRRDLLTRALGSAPRFDVAPGGNMSSLDRVVPQATQLPLLDRMVEMVVLGEDDTTWLQHKIGFKNLRNVHYYLEAARWARLIEEHAVRPTSLGRRYVSSRFEPRVILEGVRGRALFEEVMRVTGGDAPTPEVVAGVLRRWSFRYSKGTVTRRARDFCMLFGRVIDAAANPKERQLVVLSAWVEPQELLTVDGIAAIWPALQLMPVMGIRRFNKTSPDEATDAQLRLPLKETA